MEQICEGFNIDTGEYNLSKEHDVEEGDSERKPKRYVYRKESAAVDSSHKEESPSVL